MHGFHGYPPDSDQVHLPALFFSEVLPHLDHLLETQITLYCFWAVARQTGTHRYINFSEVSRDTTFLLGIRARHANPLPALEEGFERATARGTLLRAQVGDTWVYFINDEQGRHSHAALAAGTWVPDDVRRDLNVQIERPNLFVRYEQNIGKLTPMIAQQLQDMQTDYPEHWIDEAFTAAVNYNKAHLNYIWGILKRWESEGRDRTPSTMQPMTDDEYMDYLEQQFAHLMVTKK